ncbi:uncharacterized protein N7473_004762 [Penicillium subrubescens]|uniref:uncharacterized protein n=1 Tax=Penicillium subrubescens TaxID=1316194 RepID=UPI0025453BF8|nr:uncharacterized protein N7473_004762 [Penicillium subrubescens]KAJ5900692.1 hypothetical protein N7473_004762 [Penicillium subrubescens]
MGVLTRARSRRADPQPAAPAKPKPNKLQKKNPRQTRAESTTPGNAPVIETDTQCPETEWVDPLQARARPSWADPDSIFTPRVNAILKTMRPIGQYPTAGDYKSVGLTPPTKNAIKRAFKFTVRATDEGVDAIITDAPTPITPVADDGLVSDDTLVKADEGALGVGKDLGTVKGSVEAADEVANKAAVEAAVVGDLVRDADVGEVRGSSLATPTSEAIGLQTTQTSLSPLETPVDTLAEELFTNPLLTAPDTLHTTTLDTQEKPLQAHSPLITTPLITTPLEVMDTMASEIEKPVDRDLIAVLSSLPVPQSNKYDVAQLKQVVATSISYACEAGNDEVAMSLLHYWSGISDDDFKLSLIYNMGLKEIDHILEAVLKTMLRQSMEDASEWQRLQPLVCPVPGGAPGGQTFKVADIYRDTSGPRLEDLFNTGKSNTAPLKRPKKPCPVNEKSFKRRREWESDPSLDQTLRAKRARLLRDTEPEPEEAMVSLSSLRPRKGRSATVDHPPPTQFPDTTDREAIAQSVEVTSDPTPLHPRNEVAEDVGVVAQPETAAAAAAPSASAPAAAPAQVLGKRRREWSLDTTVSAESEMSNECYSDRENDWHGEYDRRQMPNSIEPPDNSDNCYECDQVGNLLCCDTCENAFHFECLRPPADPNNPPQGEWYCPSCGVRNPLTTWIAHGRHKKRKTEYTPPTDIKDYFIGVTEGLQLDSAEPKNLRNRRFYKTVPHIPRLTKPPRTKTATPAYEDESFLRMFDTDIKRAILCNICGRCTDNVRPIIRCDYCPSYFHLDCLDPPLAIPPNPRAGWMCPKHVRPEDLVITKMVDGRLQERRPRRPKHTVTSVDFDIIPYDDVNESTFDDDFREKRQLREAGDVILDFISAVQDDSARRQKNFFAGLTDTCLNLTKNMVEEHLARNSASSADEATAAIAPAINEAIENLQSGKSTKDQYDAALTLVGFAKGDSTSAE